MRVLDSSHPRDSSHCILGSLMTQGIRALGPLLATQPEAGLAPWLPTAAGCAIHKFCKTSLASHTLSPSSPPSSSPPPCLTSPEEGPRPRKEASVHDLRTRAAPAAFCRTDSADAPLGGTRSGHSAEQHCALAGSEWAHGPWSGPHNLNSLV